MRRVHLDRVVQPQDPLEEAPVEVGGRGLAPEVGSPDVAHEERVPREGEPRLGAAGRVRHDQAHALGCVPGRVEDAVLDRAEGEPLPLFEGGVREADIRGGVEAQQGARPLRELAVPGDVVGMDVGVDHVGDREVSGRRGGHVLVHVAPHRVHPTAATPCRPQPTR